MEKRIWVHNPTKTNLHVGAAIVPPGETKDFPESRVPRHLRPQEKAAEAPKPPTINETLAELLKGNVPTVVAALADMAAADIEQLELMEQAGQNRKGVLGAVAEELLNRAAQADLLAKVEAMSDETLAAELEAAKTDINIDPEYLAAIEAEAAKRNPVSPE